jgi:hypothetical protein
MSQLLPIGTVFWPILEAGSFRTFADIYTRNPELVANMKAINVRDYQTLARDFIYRADVLNPLAYTNGCEPV